MAETRKRDAGNETGPGETGKREAPLPIDPGTPMTWYACDLFYFKGSWRRSGDPIEASLTEARFHLAAGRLSRDKPSEKGGAERQADNLKKPTPAGKN